MDECALDAPEDEMSNHRDEPSNSEDNNSSDWPNEGHEPEEHPIRDRIQVIPDPGSRFPDWDKVRRSVPLPGGSQFNLTSDGASLIQFVPDPTRFEVEAVQFGAAEFRLLVDEGVIYFLFRFWHGRRALPWGDAQYSVGQYRGPHAHLMPDEADLLVEPEEGFPLATHLVDSTTGIVLATRAVILSNKLSAKLAHAITRQVQSPLSPHAYSMAVERTSGRYSTPSKMASAARRVRSRHDALAEDVTALHGQRRAVGGPGQQDPDERRRERVLHSSTAQIREVWSAVSAAFGVELSVVLVPDLAYPVALAEAKVRGIPDHEIARVLRESMTGAFMPTITTYVSRPDAGRLLDALDVRDPCTRAVASGHVPGKMDILVVSAGGVLHCRRPLPDGEPAAQEGGLVMARLPVAIDSTNQLNLIRVTLPCDPGVLARAMSEAADCREEFTITLHGLPNEQEVFDHPDVIALFEQAAVILTKVGALDYVTARMVEDAPRPEGDGFGRLFGPHPFIGGHQFRLIAAGAFKVHFAPGECGHVADPSVVELVMRDMAIATAAHGHGKESGPREDARREEPGGLDTVKSALRDMKSVMEAHAHRMERRPRKGSRRGSPGDFDAFKNGMDEILRRLVHIAGNDDY